MSTEISKAKIIEALSRGRLMAAEKAPYFQHLLLAFVVREAPGLGTIAITKTGFFLYDPVWVARYIANVPIIAGGWLHECGHRITLTHERRGSRRVDLWNQAADLAINPMVRELGGKLPDNVLWPAKFGWTEGQTADAYYELLLKREQSGEESIGEDEPSIGAGWCGSCGGRAVDHEPADGDPEGRSESDLDRVVQTTIEAVAAHAKAKGAGSIPSSLRRFVDEALKPPVVPWQRKLSKAARGAAAWAAGAYDHRYDAPGKRQAGLGYGAGCPILPRLRRPVPRVSLVLDTSGSMGSSELADGLAETQGIFRAVGAEIDFMAIDAVVHSLQAVSTIRDLLPLIKGGGGTDFRPAFEALKKRRPRPQIVVFVTDGCGPAPEKPPADTKVIWLLVGPWTQVPAPWGEVVKIPHERGSKTIL